MADSRVTDLTGLSGSGVDAANDQLPIVDVSAAVTSRSKKITPKDLLTSFGQAFNAHYSSAANYETARDALTGTLGLPKIEVVGTEMVLLGTSGADRKIAAGEATILSTLNRYTILGYNVANDGASIPDAAESSYMTAFESNFNNGSYRQCEWHVNMAVPGGSFKRPFYSDMAITGGDAGKIVTTFVLSELTLALYAKDVNVEAAAAYTEGAKLHLTSLDTGGKDWTLYSTGSVLSLGAGHFFIFNTTNTKYGLICDKNGSVITGDLAAIATNATDGFLYVPTCAGTPTGTPTAYTGKAPIVIDTTNNKLYFRSGGAWRDAGP